MFWDSLATVSCWSLGSADSSFVIIIFNELFIQKYFTFLSEPAFIMNLNVAFGQTHWSERSVAKRGSFNLETSQDVNKKS